MALNIFNFIDLLFSDIQSLDRPEVVLQFTDSFMLNRRLAIGYPKQANYIQNLGISEPSHVLEMWKSFIKAEIARGNVRGKPRWIWTKGSKAITSKVDKEKDYPSSLLQELSDFYNYPVETLEECTLYSSTRTVLDQLISDMKKTKKMIEDPAQVKNIKKK